MEANHGLFLWPSVRPRLTFPSYFHKDSKLSSAGSATWYIKKKKKTQDAVKLKWLAKAKEVNIFLVQ